jgi:hypothetical protein
MLQAANRHPVFLLLAAFLLASIPALRAGWVWEEPIPQGNALVSVAASPDGIWVAAGDYGAILRRPSGGNWQPLPSFANGQALSSVCWSGSQFLATGPAAGLWQSSDGVSWTSIDASIGGRVVLAASGRVLCLGSERLWVSSGGGFQTLPLSSANLESFRAAASAAGRFLVLRRNRTLATSSDGLSWNSVEPAPGTLFFTAVGGATGFLAGGFKPNGSSFVPALFRSTNGEVWSEIPLPADSNYLYNLLESAGGWLLDELVQDAGMLFRRGVIHQFAGSGWQKLSSAPAGFIPYDGMAINATDTLLVGDRGASYLLSSGSSFQKLHTSVFESPILDPARFTAAGVADTVVAIDKNVTRADFAPYYTTANGSSWSKPFPVPLPAITALAVSQGSLIGFSHFNPTVPRGFYRLSGANWSPLVPEDESGLDLISLDSPVVSFAANADASKVVALTRQESFGEASYSAIRGLYTGSNWKDWAPAPLPEARLLQPPSESSAESVQWDGTRFVLLLHPGRVFTSANGLSWNLLPPLPADSKEKLAADYPGSNIPAQNHAIALASDGARIVARAAKLDSRGLPIPSLPAESETFFVFEQGRWWPKSIASPVSPERRRILHDGSRFLAIGDGVLLSSPDARSWSSLPLPATAVQLLSTGTKLVAFTDSFGVLTRSGPLAAGTPLEVPFLDPLVKNLDSTAHTYSLEISLPARPWTVSGVPPWMTVSPTSGNGTATLAISVQPNTGKTARGSILRIGDLSHLVAQQAPVPLQTISVVPKQTTITLPFSGPWNAAVSAPFASLPKGANSGTGNVRVTLPANPTPSSREVVVNLNGLDHTIVQAGTPSAELRAGSYTGLLGALFPGSTPVDLSALESYEGSVSITLSRPTPAAPHGTYTASLSLFQNGATHQFRAMGPVNPDGTITGTWISTGKTPLQAIVSLSILDDLALQKTLTGTVTLAGSDSPLALFASKQVFDAKANPLPAQVAGKATFFLTTFGNLGVNADTAIGSATLLPNGALRLTGTLADGSKFSASSFVWGAASPQFAAPIQVPLSRGASLLAGYLLFDPTQDTSDWSGPLNRLTTAAPAQLTGSLTRYIPPSRGKPLLEWASPAAFTYASAQFSLVTGTVSLPKPSSLAISLNTPPAKASIKVNASTGLATGQFAPATPGTKPIPLLGAVNQKTSGLDGSKGSILGFVPKVPGDIFTILHP